MRKLYTLICFVFAASIAIAQQPKVVSLTLYDLTNEALNKTYVDSEGNTITIATSEPLYKGAETFSYKSTVTNPLECIGQTPSNPATDPSGKYTTAILMGNATASIALSPSILITVAGDDKISDIEMLGYASSGGSSIAARAELVCAFSTTNTSNNSFDLNWEYEEFTTSFNQADCTDNNRREFLPGTKYIKLIATSNFASTGVTSFACNPMLHAIRFYATKSVVGIGEDKENALEINLNDRNLHVNESVDLTIYSLTGIKVLESKNIQDVNLSFLNAGVYIIKAKNGNGQEKLQKIVIR